MKDRKNLKHELVALKREIDQLKSREKDKEIQAVMAGKATSEKVSSSLLSILQIMMDENKRTRTLIQHVSEQLDKFASEIDAEIAEEPVQALNTSGEEQTASEIPLSSLDTKIIQQIQIKGMACADDIKGIMNYKGRNAASARLNRLYRQGVIERYQLGHKVYYKYNAGKTSNRILIVSPPQ